jgi:hypothetical protein
MWIGFIGLKIGHSEVFFYERGSVRRKEIDEVFYLLEYNDT